jgi:hypothetical protein
MPYMNNELSIINDNYLLQYKSKNINLISLKNEDKRIYFIETTNISIINILLIINIIIIQWLYFFSYLFYIKNLLFILYILIIYKLYKKLNLKY